MGDHAPDGRARLTDTQAPGWRHPGQHLARRAEVRTPAEIMNLLALDALIATYGMDADELHDLMLQVRSLYRGGGQVTRRQALFLGDVDRVGRPLGPPMRAVQDADSGWRLVPRHGPEAR